MRQICALLFLFTLLNGCHSDYVHSINFWGTEKDDHYTQWATYIRKWSKTDPLNDGSAAQLEPKSPQIVAKPADLKITYLVGQEGIARGGSIAIGPYFIWSIARGVGRFSINEKEPGFVTATCSNPGVELSLNPVVHNFGTGFLVIGVNRASLKKGDTIKLDVKRFQVPSHNFRNVEFVVAVDTRGNREYRRLERMKLPLKSEAPFRLYVRTWLNAAVGEPFPVTITCLDEFNNIAHDYRGTVKIPSPKGCKNLPESYTFTEKDNGNHVFERVSIESKGVLTFRVEDESRKWSFESNPISIGWLPQGYHIYMGDIHCHTVFSDGIGYPSDAYTWGRNVENLAFAAVSDHSEDRFVIPWTSDKIKTYMEAVHGFHEDKRFCTFYAYEWTSNKPGHHNVYHEHPHGPIYSKDVEETSHLDQLLEKLAKQKNSVIAIPHHPKVEANWTFSGYRKYPHLVPLIEICSNWGSSEDRRIRKTGDTVQEALAAGLKMGLMGSTDDHTGRAGYGKGLCGLFAKDLTRSSIFDAFHNRRTFATSGVPIILVAEANGQLMGSIFKTNDKPSFSVQVIGTAPLRTVEILRNNQVIHAWNGKDGSNPRIYLRWGWEGHTFEGQYGLWKGKASLSEGRFVEVRAIGFDPVKFMSQAGDKPIQQPNQKTFEWENNTDLADVDTITATIEAPPDATLIIQLGKEVIPYQISDIPTLTTKISTETINGIPSKWLEISRREPLGTREAKLEWTDPKPLQGESFYYIRLIQEDDEMAWSSPFWITYTTKD